jgi:hypothetical protein
MNATCSRHIGSIRCRGPSDIDVMSTEPSGTIYTKACRPISRFAKHACRTCGFANWLGMHVAPYS